MRRSCYPVALAGALAFSLVAVGVPAQGRRSGTGKGTEAIVGTLIEDLDSLNTVVSGQARDISALKQRAEDLDRKAGEAVEAIKPVAKDVEELKADVAGLKRDVGGLKALIDTGAKKLFWVTPIFQLRIRPEYQRNRIDMSSDSKDQDLYYAQRVRFGFAVQPTKGVRGVVVAQDARLWGTEASTLSNDSNLDLHEGYLLLEDLFTPGLEVQAGRFEMHFGAGRQVGRNDWTIGRAFDGARIAYRMPDVFRVDLFGAVVRDAPPLAGPVPVPTQLGVAASKAAGATDLNFYGLYATVDAYKPVQGEVYGFYLHDNATNAAQRIGTVGARLVALPVTGLKLEGEAAVQFGAVDTRDETGAVVEARHLATAYHADVSYELPVTTAPAIGFVFDSASGDANPFDDESVAYQPLFPTRHGLYGIADLFHWQGIWALGPTFRMQPHPKVHVRLDYRYFALSTGEDGGPVRAFDGVVEFRPGEPRTIGHEFDLIAGWQPLEWLSLEAGYGVFKPGAGTEGASATAGGVTRVLGGDPAHFAYFQTVLGI